VKPIDFAKPAKLRFKSVSDAKLALTLDKLGAAYVKGDRVFVITNQGTGEFDYKEWKRG